LLVPYLLWNLLLIVFYAIVQAIPAFSSYFTGANKRIADYVFEDYILAFWDKGEGILNNATPVLQPFWYIRNLILLSILSPIIYLVAKNLTRFIVIPLLAGWWCLTPYLAFCEISVLFFLLGATSALRQWDFLHSEVRMQFCVCATLCLMDYLAHVVVPIGGWLLMIHRAFLLSAVFFSFIFVTRVSAFLRRPMTWGLQYSFFIYACHYPIVIILCKSAMNFIHTDSLGWQLIVYVSIIVISVAMCIGIYHLLQKKCPKVLNILTGSR
ncbi:MAG: hypothetical protein HUK03_10130, partial [Bacteroidaceae bacterium]|nr:hypothetical protein [Bacteroidaceae bacterium]